MQHDATKTTAGSKDILDQYAKWSKLYNDIVLKRAGQ
jgi:hypothetical protein